MAKGLDSLELKDTISREEFSTWTEISIACPTRQNDILNLFKANQDTAFLGSEITKRIYGESTKTTKGNCSQILYKLKKAGYIWNKKPYWIFAKHAIPETKKDGGEQ